MKLQLDTEKKTISIEEDVNFGELIALLENLLPNNKWKEFKLETKTTINWTNPIVIDRYPQPSQPYWQPWITYGQDSGNPPLQLPGDSNYNLTNGVYSVEVSN